MLDRLAIALCLSDTLLSPKGRSETKTYEKPYLRTEQLSPAKDLVAYSIFISHPFKMQIAVAGDANWWKRQCDNTAECFLGRN